jgi:hypothetical protein
LVTTIASYLAVAGSVASAVSQVTTDTEDPTATTNEYKLPF